MGRIKPLTSAEAREVITGLFCGQSHRDLPTLHWLFPNQEPLEIVAGHVFRALMRKENNNPVAVTIFAPLGPLAAQLWEQDGRTLAYVTGIGHPALPEILAAGVKGDCLPAHPGEKLAYVISTRGRSLLDHPEVIDLFRSQPLTVVRQILSLADALDLLYGGGLVHRNLSPHSLELARGADAGNPSLALARFEMSTYESNLLRSLFNETDEPSESGQFRTLYINQNRDALLYSPPERLDWLFHDDSELEAPEQSWGDMYSLGLLAFQWLVGDFEPEFVELAFPSQAGRLDQRAWNFSRDGWRVFRNRLIGRVHQSSLPSRLRVLVERMLHEFPRNRPTARELVEELTRVYDSLAVELEGEPDPRPHIIAFQSQGFHDTLFKWGRLHFDPLTDDGKTELVDFLRADLERGFLEYCPAGFTVIERDGGAGRASATYVLRGTKFLYFAALYLEVGRQIPHVLLIRFVLSLSDPRYGDYPDPPIRRPLPTVEFHPTDSDIVSRHAIPYYPAWQTLLSTVQYETSMPPKHQSFYDTLQWLLREEKTELDAHQYAFRRVHVGQHHEMELEFDATRDENRLIKRPLLALYASNPNRRPAFDDFFRHLEDQGLRGYVRWRADVEGQPSGDFTRSGTAEVLRKRAGPNRIVIRLDAEGPSVPAVGWLEPDDDYGSHRQHRLHVGAVQRLQRHRALMGALTGGMAFISPLDRWSGADKAFRDRHDNEVNALAGGAEALLRDFLNASPVYALQGPPGTGKTTIAARAVRAMLMRHPERRILVSAQSHLALDHLATTIMRWTAPGVTAVRIVSPHTKEKIQLPEIQELLPEPQASRLVEKIKLHCQQRKAEPGTKFKDILGRWETQAGNSELEIRDRLRQGANLVFATCAGATDYALGTSGVRPDFDWVIIEEAAKAWPTELLVPLLQGRRWALLGDHRQLPAYRRREVGDFLKECVDAPAVELRRMGERSAEFERFFDLFGSFFDDVPEVSDTSLRRASGRLTVQHRMERRLGDLVGSVFYDGRLLPGRNADARHDIDHPGEFAGQSMVWVDTSGIEECHDDAPIRSNRAEAAIVVEVLRRARLQPMGRPGLNGSRSAVVLTPYRKQIDLLMAQPRIPEGFRAQIFTVDSFQGREAEVVVVSMVRSSQQEPNSVRAIGFLADLQRMNVLFSRAQSLLVVVGNLNYLEKVGALGESYEQGKFWTSLAAQIRSGGSRLVSARRFMTDEGENQS